jgi:hypothetical protein
MLHATFGFRELWGFKDFSFASGMLSATVNEAKSTQNCPKLPKSAQRQNLKYHQKSRF